MKIRKEIMIFARILFAVTIIFGVLDYFAPEVFAEEEEQQEIESSRNYISFYEWQIKDPYERGLYMRTALDENGVAYTNWDNGLWEGYTEVDPFGSYEIYVNAFNYELSYQGDTPVGIVNNFVDSRLSDMEDSGICDFSAYNGGGGVSGGSHGGGGVSGHRKDDFYNGATGGNSTDFDLGNGYVIKCTADFISNDCYWAGFNLYFNGEYTYTSHRFSEFYEGGIKQNVPPLLNGYSNDRFYLSKSNDHIYLNYSGVLGNYNYDITSWCTYLPSGMSDNDVVPRVINPFGSLPENYEPVDGSDQSGVNEELQKQNSEILQWLEKIYNEECVINGTIQSLNNSFLSGINSIKGLLQSLLSNAQSILAKLDNLNIKLKDKNGNDIDLGDLNLGDLNIDFDTVYSVTGITKVTSPSDLTQNFTSYRTQIENKTGMTNMKTNINRFTNALFGKTLFNQQGTLINSSYASNSDAPHLYFTFLNVQYDLFAYLYMIPANDVSTFKEIASYFMYFATALMIFRSLPSVIGGVAGLQSKTEQINFAIEERQYNEFQNEHFGFGIGNEYEIMYPYKGRWL